MGAPRVVVVHRAGIAAYAETVAALRRLGRYAVQAITIEPQEAADDIKVDLQDASANVVVALGALAQQRCTQARLRVPVVVAYGTGDAPPHRLRGGWIETVPPAALVVRWARRVRPGLRRLGVLTPAAAPRIAGRFRRAGQRLGVQVSVADAAAAGGPLDAALRLIRQGVQAIWLGPDYRLWTAARLLALRRLQHLFGVPLIGQTAAQVRRGLTLAVDAAPESVAAAVADLIQRELPHWLAGPAARQRRLRRGRHRRGRHRRGRHRRERGLSAQATHRIRRVPPARWRVVVHPRAAARFGASRDALRRAGAVEVSP